MTRALVISCLVAVLVAGCGVVQPPIDRSLSVRGPGGGERLYPGRAFACSEVGRCPELVAEIGRWADRAMPRAGAPTDVSFHGAVDDAGRTILLTRSGGSTWIAVMSFADGTRAAAMVGCGVGVDPKRCFSSP